MFFGKQISPPFVCLSEHHMKVQEINSFSVPGYSLATYYCWCCYLKGGVCILARSDIKYHKIDLNQYCRDKIFEICAVKLKSKTTNLIFGCIYRALSDNIDQFLNLLGDALKYLHASFVERTTWRHECKLSCRRL